MASKKRNYMEISSSDESNPSPPESDYDAAEEITSSSHDDGDDDDDEWNNDSEDDEAAEVDEAEDEDCDDSRVDKDDAECIQLIRRRGSDLQELKLDECKAYLRRHRLRLSGTKGECIERIEEHWRLKDGNGEAFYPRSSFIIDCTGDVCKGDVVLFDQKVYIFDKSTRNRIRRGRTVAGRIVKESYGAAKQQHTFTVEVLWSRGARRLDPLFPLLVKGRKLYRFKTYRQQWRNEKERLEVLSEKHKRGAEARTIRAMRKTKPETKTYESRAYKGAKRYKDFHRLSPSRKRETTHAKKNCQNEYGKVVFRNKKQNPSKRHAPFQTLTSNGDGNFKDPASRRRHQNLIHSDQVREFPPYPHYYPYQSHYHFHSDGFHRELHPFPSYTDSAYIARPSHSHPIPTSLPEPISRWKELGHDRYTDPSHSHSRRRARERRNFKCYPQSGHNHPSFHSSTSNTRGWR